MHNTELNTELRTLAREYERANTDYHEALSDPGCSDALLDQLDAECERILLLLDEQRELVRAVRTLAQNPGQ